MSDSQESSISRRERSARYPSVPLAEAVSFCKQIDELGIDGLTAAQIATAMGYKNVKTNTFSGRLSSARQFNLIDLSDQNYSLTELALRILHPIDPDEVPVLLKQACQSPHLFSELMKQYAGKRLPEPEILANLLMHKHQITASAKLAASESFYASIQHAGMLDDQRILDINSASPISIMLSSEPPRLNQAPKAGSIATATIQATPKTPPKQPIGLEHQVRSSFKPRQDEIRLDLPLWDADHGKQVRLRAPASMTKASLDRFIQAMKLAIRITEND